MVKQDKSNIIERINSSDKVYKKVRNVIPIILSKFKPVVLHSENLIVDAGGVIVAPNHQSTLDPLIITSIIDKNIHWAALKRFFDAQDSIFNNSKNPILCQITSKMFRKLEYFPIERMYDNPKANNMNSIRNMLNFLKQKQYVGIFPEGTTNKSENDFGTFDPGFIQIAMKTNAHIQPITVLWIKEKKISNQIIVNIGQPFSISGMTKDEIYEKYINIQKSQLKENHQRKVELQTQYCI